MSKPMSEQMQKLAARYEKATGKKFNAKTNAQKIRSMTDRDKRHAHKNVSLSSAGESRVLILG